MAKSKSARIPSLDPKKLPDGIELRKVERKEQRRDEQGNALVGSDKKPIWDRTLVDVFHVTGADGFLAFQEHVTNRGPEGYDGNMFACDLLNSHLNSFQVGEEINKAPSPNYVDPSEAAGERVKAAVMEAAKRGEVPDFKALQKMYAEALAGK